MTRNRALLLLIGITLVGFALRIYQLDRLSLRGDEALTVSTWTRQPLLETLNSEIVVRDPQPPLALAFFRGWSLYFGRVDEFGIRVLPALMNTIGVAAMYALAKRMATRRIGLLAAFFWAVHPFLIWHAQDARNYAIWVVFTTLALWAALRALQKRKRIDWLLYIVFATTAAYLYYLELFLVCALNIYVLIGYWRNRSVLRSWIFSQIVVGLLLAPWYLQSRLLFNDIYGGTSFPFEPIRTLTWIIPSLNFGRTISEALMSNIWWVLLLILATGIVLQWRRNRAYGIFLALIGFLPLLLLDIVSLRMNIFTPRYVLAVVPVYILLMVTVLDSMGKISSNPTLKCLPRILFAGGWLLIIGLSLNNLYFSNDYAKVVDWRGLANYLSANVTSSDIVIQAAADEAFTHYFNDLTHFDRIPANPRQSSREIVNLLENAAADYHSIWVVARTPGDWPNREIGLDWLARNMQEVRHTQIGEPPIDIPIRQFMPWQVRSSEIDSTPLGVFENVAQLVGIHIMTAPEPTGELVMWVYWKPVGKTEKALKAFMHLVGPVNPSTGSPLWSQDDHFPQHMRINTVDWSTSEVFRDTFEISLTEVPPGQYTLHIGLYDPDTGERIRTATGDSYEIGTLTLP